MVFTFFITPFTCVGGTFFCRWCGCCDLKPKVVVYVFITPFTCVGGTFVVGAAVSTIIGAVDVVCSRLLVALVVVDDGGLDVVAAYLEARLWYARFDHSFYLCKLHKYTLRPTLRLLLFTALQGAIERRFPSHVGRQTCFPRW